MGFFMFLGEVARSPMLLLAVLPSLLLMLVNGWTDAPVTVATAIRSGAITLKRAVALAALCNFFGALVMMVLGNKVAVSIYSISGFGELPTSSVGTALISAFLSVAVWSLFSLRYGIPTSESHALTAALFGSAAAVVGADAFQTEEWTKVFIGILISSLPTFVFAKYISRKLDERYNARKDIDKRFKRLQILGAAVSSFAHGAQDGGKFAAIFAVTLSVVIKKSTAEFKVPLWCVVLSAVVISLGMLLGGRRIIQNFETFSSKKSSSGFAADITSSALLVIMSLFGISASTTHAKTCAVLGASAEQGLSKSQSKATVKLTAFWFLTFPVCIALGFILSYILRFLMKM